MKAKRSSGRPFAHHLPGDARLLRELAAVLSEPVPPPPDPAAVVRELLRRLPPGFDLDAAPEDEL